MLVFYKYRTKCIFFIICFIREIFSPRLNHLHSLFYSSEIRLEIYLVFFLRNQSFSWIFFSNYRSFFYKPSTITTAYIHESFRYLSRYSYLQQFFQKFFLEFLQRIAQVFLLGWLQIYSDLYSRILSRSFPTISAEITLKSIPWQFSNKIKEFFYNLHRVLPNSVRYFFFSDITLKNFSGFSSVFLFLQVFCQERHHVIL